MGVFLKWRGDRLSPQWWGFWQADGKRHEVAVCPWHGTPPAKGEKCGDALFEKSRTLAEERFKRIRDGERSAEEEVALTKQVLSARYGLKVERVKIADLAAKWDGLPRKADTSEGWRSLVHTVLQRFVKYMEGNFPNVTEAGALTEEHFKGFLESVDAMGVSAKTWNYHLTILRGVLAKVDGQSRGFRDYLAKLPKRTEATIHRKPFEVAELDAIFTAAKETDPELYPVLVAAACTALRRGDVCRLRWDSVDMEEGFATVKTTKTGETVDIPIFPPFMAVLKEAEAKRKQGVPYVFPRIALEYGSNPDGLNWRLEKVLGGAGFARPERADKKRKRAQEGNGNGGKYPAPEDEEAAAIALEDGMEREGWTAKRKAKARRILALHYAGKNGQEIAAEIGTSKGGVSDYFRTMETAGKIALVSAPEQESAGQAMRAEIRDDERRVRRGSLCGWHSFRTTFCTLALANGVPMEILQKITGHRTAEIVLKHYDRRGREEIRKALGAAMPKAIAGAIGDGGEAAEKAAKPVDAELVAVPPELADLLANASKADFAKIAKILQKKGGAK